LLNSDRRRRSSANWRDAGNRCSNAHPEPASPSLDGLEADGRFDRHEMGRLLDFLTEAQNPRNFQRVIRLIAEMPLAILPEEVVLVDTPGLGSLALEGAAETLAYLPHCRKHK
jgi:hypothetical protein